MKPLQDLTGEGQSVWLDYIRRSFTRGGELAKLVAAGVRGVTSNPAIFEKAIAGGDEYDDGLRQLLDAWPGSTPDELFEALAIVDIQEAADVLRPVYDASGGADGFVSLEVSPTLADDAEGTIREARRMWAAVDRPNLMIKVPATDPGIAAFEELTAEGINVNVTLMFSMQHYEDVAQAYLRGLSRAADPARVASVASFFVSRVDTAVDEQLDAIGSEEAMALRGTAAVANAKLAYRRYQEIFEGPSFSDLSARGARPQRVLWASTGTKDPAYSDVKYIEELVGDNTVNTVPPATLDAFVDHGKTRADAVVEDVTEADAAIRGLAAVGVDLDGITDGLQEDGVDAFAASYRQLLEAIATESRRLLAESAPPQQMALSGLAAEVDAVLDRWGEEDVAARIFAKDPTVWFADDRPELADRLGWLDLPRKMRPLLDDIRWFVDGVRADGFTDVILLGMGGSSLAPDVFRRVFGSAEGHPRLVVLDSTHPAAVAAVDEAIDPATSLFLVSSKSGTTIEPLALFDRFWASVAGAVDEPGRHFAAITDPGSPLAALGAEKGFRKVFEAPADVGGRYSALTHFGLVPAALIGADVGLLLDQALRMAAAGAADAPSNPALRLGAAIGLAAGSGRDKLTVVTSDGLDALPDWYEQLVAESLGKDNSGVVPVVGELLSDPDGYGADRFFVSFSLDGYHDPALVSLEEAGHPVARIDLGRREDVAAEMFRAELAVAAAGIVLGVHPFDQPDVEIAKELARQAMAGDSTSASIEPATDGAAVAALAGLLADADSGSYLAIQAFVAPSAAVEESLQRLRAALRDRNGIATTVGFGPRFLHSTGQLHKGGPDTGLFVQIVDDAETDLPVPGRGFTFGELIAAQADGDYRALQDRGRSIVRLGVGADAAAGLAELAAAFAPSD